MNFDRGERTDGNMDMGMLGDEACRQESDNRLRHGDHADGKISGQVSLHLAQFLPQGRIIGQEVLGPREHPLALMGKAGKALISRHDQDAKIFFELLDSGGKGGLRNVARCGRPGEMPLSGKSGKIFKLAHHQKRA
jgi:hypothetical protein